MVDSAKLEHVKLFSAYTPKRVRAVRPPRSRARRWWTTPGGRRVAAVGLALGLGVLCVLAPVRAKPLCDALGKVTLAELIKLLVGG